MGIRFGLRWQIALVVVLFAASVAVLLSSSLAVLWMSAHEAQTQNELTEAIGRMAADAAMLLGELPESPRKKPPPDWAPRLTDITSRALVDYPGVEGGFYLAGPWDKGKFVGHAFPSNPHGPPETSPEGPPAALPLSPDPPPNEKSLVFGQCQASLTAEPDAPPIVATRNIGPSRVMVVTEPVGGQRPALMAAWVMIRLSSPEQLAEDARRNRVAAGLALAGIVAALGLTVNLGRNLRTERRQREKLREELRRAEHLAALGKLLAGVAHEVRNPLAAIRSTVQLCQRLPPQARDPSALDSILQSVDRLNALVSRLLFFVRSGHEEQRPVDVNAVVRETLALLRPQAEAQGVALQTELAADLPPVSGSAQALQQVAINLTTNALQATPNGGTLRCRTRRLDAPPRVELSVADTGPGVAPADQAHLFEPFWTTRPEGAGLGLALCREIVQQHGGKIELDAQPGWGAVFRVTLPLETSV